MQWGYVDRTPYMFTQTVFPIPFPHKCLSFVVSLDFWSSYLNNNTADRDCTVVLHVVGKPSNTSAITYYSDIERYENPTSINYSRILSQSRKYSFFWNAIGY